MIYKDLGKTHAIKIITMSVSVMHMVAFIASALCSFLAFAWHVTPFPLWLNFGLIFVVTLGVAKVSEVPFCKELFINQLKNRVSYDP